MLIPLNKLTDDEIEVCRNLQLQCFEIAKKRGIPIREFFKMLIKENCIRVVLLSSDSKFQFNMNEKPKDSFKFELTHIDIKKTTEFITEQTNLLLFEQLPYKNNNL